MNTIVNENTKSEKKVQHHSSEQHDVSSTSNDKKFEFNEETGFISDLTTGMQWAVGPDQDTTFIDAEVWIRSLGEGWEFPKVSDLQHLFDSGVKDLDWGLFTNTGWWVWTSETLDRSKSNAKIFSFGYTYARVEYLPKEISKRNNRVFAMRKLLSD